MSAILNSLNVHNFPIFQPILMKLVSKFVVFRALSDKTYLLSGLLSPLTLSGNWYAKRRRRASVWTVGRGHAVSENAHNS